MSPPTRRTPGGAPGSAQTANTTSYLHDTALRCSTTYSVDLADEILTRLEAVAVTLAAAAMCTAALTPDECASLVKLIDKAQRLVGLAIGGAR